MLQSNLVPALSDSLAQLIVFLAHIAQHCIASVSTLLAIEYCVFPL